MKLEGPTLGRLIAVVMALTYLVTALTWGQIVAKHDAPDEPEHLAVALFIADHGRLPILEQDLRGHLINHLTNEIVEIPDPDPETGESSLSIPMRELPFHRIQVHYASRPGLSYVLAAAMIRCGRALGVSSDLVWARASSALCGGLAILMLGLLAVSLRPRRSDLHVLVPAFFALLPQFVFVGAYVNGDAYTAMACALLYWSLLHAMRSGWSMRNALWIGVPCGLVLLGTKNGSIALPFAALALIGAQWRSPGRCLLRGALVLCGALLVAGPWLLHNLQHYGDVFGGAAVRSSWSMAQQRLPEVARELVIGGQLTSAADHGETVWTLLSGRWREATEMSFIGMFGWLRRPLEPWQYRLVKAVFAAGALGALWSLVERLVRRRPPADAAFLAIITAAAVATFAGMLWFSLHGDYQPQGRYFFSAAAGWSVTMAVGVTAPATTLRTRFIAVGVVVGALATVLCTAAQHLADGRTP